MNPILIFPGQGSLHEFNSRLLYQLFPDLKKKLQEASDIVQSDLVAKFERGSVIETQYQQPLTCILSATVLSKFQFKPTVGYAGHSLGELTACFAAGVFDFKALVSIAYARAKFMHRASDQLDGGMLVVMGMSIGELRSVIEEGYENSIFVANINSPQQVVLSGIINDLLEFCKLIRSRFAVVSKLLKVSGPWHSPLIKSAADQFNEYLAQFIFSPPKNHLYMTYSQGAANDIDQIKKNLVSQICSPVYWSALIEKIAETEKNAIFVEIGYQPVLKGLIGRIHQSAHAYCISDKRDLRRLACLGYLMEESKQCH